ncbi:histo-blood group ABO system transferase-like isoform X2 [Pelobates fuscus]|uniref:histo-blood group ABO system transferase-like isoform X1 n=1 Tax=Pelobates fuscus TaxID=191477 RepID=UPI002FE4612C
MAHLYLKKGILLFLLVLLVFSISYTWYALRTNAWHPVLLLNCNAQKENKDARTATTAGVSSRYSVDQIKEAELLQRMLYEKPRALNPTRTDVVMMTPWLAPIMWNGTYNIDILNAQFHQRGVCIGLAMFAIKKYVVFLKQFIETAEKFFMVGHKVNYYILTDRVEEVRQYNFTLGEGRQLFTLQSPTYKRWQDICFRRMEMIRNYTRDRFINEVDYLAVADIDMQFSDDVGVESLSELFGTIHPGYYNAPRQSFTYERRPQSRAYIPYDEGDFYYAAGYFGGTTEEIYKLTNYCHNGIMADREKHIEAIWHEESHLNKYFIYYKPTKLLSPEYLWDNRMGIPGFLKRRRFVAVPKNHNEIRNKRSIKEKQVASQNAKH